MFLRCFIALELDSPIQHHLGALQKQWRSHPELNDKAINWVRPEAMHLTLKFLGDVPDAQISEVCQAASRAAEVIAPFDFELGHTGCFPPHGSARVLWVGVSRGEEQLRHLQAELEKLLTELGFAPEGRQYHPHLTLARIKNIAVGHRVRQAQEKAPPIIIGQQAANTITVFQSVLNRSGPVYTPLHHAELRGHH